MTKPKLLISACLIGEQCRYDNKIITRQSALELAEMYDLMPICPEMLGGLPVPRPPAEIEKGSGGDVLDGKSRIFTDKGEDITGNFIRGANKTLQIARENGILKAFLKSKSPSCGINSIRINGQPASGEGVTAALLRRNGLEIEEID